MLIKLTTTFNLNSYINIASLPSSTSSSTSYSSICSWGFNSSSKETKSLMCYSGNNANLETCNGSSGWKGLVYSPEQMCIEGSPTSPGVCFHDGGAPAVHGNKVYGLYSFPDLQSSGKTYPASAKCNDLNKPGVFTQVNHFLNWI